MINPIKIFVKKVYINIKLLLLIIFVLKAIENSVYTPFNLFKMNNKKFGNYILPLQSIQTVTHLSLKAELIILC